MEAKTFDELIKNLENDIDMDKAIRAFHNVSFDPEKRAKTFVYGLYTEKLADTFKELAELAQTEEQKEVAIKECLIFNIKYLEKFRDLLYRQAGLASSAICGPANFPAEKMQRKLKKFEEVYDNNLKWYDRQVYKIKKAIEEVHKEKVEHETVAENNGIKAVNNTEWERVQLHFDKIPSVDVRAFLKKNGFRWSPAVKVWQRQNTDNGLNAARYVVQVIPERYPTWWQV